jgi:peptide deformylase
MHEQLKIICWPDARLLRPSAPVERFDAGLGELAGRMLQLMREARGVGLAAPQVGINRRLFVMNPTGRAEDDRVYVNPVLSEASGDEEGEEGCLSLPGINARILRSRSVKLDAQDLAGRPVQLAESGYLARIWQHEIDHLNGVLILDRMTPVARLASRKALRELEDRHSGQVLAGAARRKPVL